MLSILNPSVDPVFNIATEEYLLKNHGEDIFMLYRNKPSIIVGKHQNTFAEINYWFVKENNIIVVRRLSGGGTVFHDLGNINFTFIQNGREGSLVDFVKFTEPIIITLQKMGVPASRSGRNDILINGLKISGNAEHVYKNRTLHHGTLLFSSKLDDLRQGLNSNPEYFTDKAVKSVRSQVTNISNYLPEYTVDEFIKKVQLSVLELYPNTEEYTFSDSETNAILKLVEDKYSTWEWNYGYSPKFKVKKNGIINNSEVSVIIEVDKGIILDIQSANNRIELPNAIKSLAGIQYNDEKVRAELSINLPINEINDWVYLIF